MRVYRPSTATRDLPVVVFFHGGGWVLGSTRMYDPLCSFLAAEVGGGGAERRLPDGAEHRAPTAALDCVDAVRQVSAHGERWSADTSRLAVAGDSAGGNLAAVVAQVVRDDGGPVIAHQALIYPGTDATMSQPSIRQHADAPVLTRPKIEAFLAHYRGPDGLATHDPLLSPLWAADHSGLPPALVQTADLDPLRDEGALYATRLKADQRGLDVSFLRDAEGVGIRPIDLKLPLNETTLAGGIIGLGLRLWCQPDRTPPPTPARRSRFPYAECFSCECSRPCSSHAIFNIAKHAIWTRRNILPSRLLPARNRSSSPASMRVSSTQVANCPRTATPGRRRRATLVSH